MNMKKFNWIDGDKDYFSIVKKMTMDSAIKNNEYFLMD
jgi:hypothetical protein